MKKAKPRNPLTELFGDFPDRLQGDCWRPAVDVIEADQEVRVRVEIAGVRRDSLRVSIQGDQLRVRGERIPVREEGVLRHHQAEIAFGPFERVVKMAVPFERDRVSARLEEGFLTIVLPKRGPVHRRIEIETESG